VRDDIVVDVDEDALRGFVLEVIDEHIVDKPSVWREEMDGRR
jgi:hypothetical protein